MLEVRHATERDAAEWDAFVGAHPESRFSHLWGYRRMLEGCGYRCVYLVITSQGCMVGVFPSIVAGHGRRRLVSQPFIEYGGPLLRDVSEDRMGIVPELLLKAARAHGCQCVEIRGGLGAEFMAESKYVIRHPLHSYGVLTLDAKETLWRRSLTNEARKGVNKAQKSGLRGEVCRGDAAVADPFYQLYLVSMKRLGVPPHSRRYFTDLAAGLGDSLVASWVWHDQQVAAVLLGAISGQRLQIFITASSPDHWAMRPNDFAHWELISWAVDNQLRWFDFGSARYEGQIRFKKKWGVELGEYSYYLIGEPGSKETGKIQTVETSSNSMQTMAKLWGKLVPVGMTKVLGPPLRRFLTK